MFLSKDKGILNARAFGVNHPSIKTPTALTVFLDARIVRQDFLSIERNAPIAQR